QGPHEKGGHLTTSHHVIGAETIVGGWVTTASDPALGQPFDLRDEGVVGPDIDEAIPQSDRRGGRRHDTKSNDDCNPTTQNDLQCKRSVGSLPPLGSSTRAIGTRAGVGCGGTEATLASPGPWRSLVARLTGGHRLKQPGFSATARDSPSARRSLARTLRAGHPRLDSASTAHCGQSNESGCDGC